MNNYIRPDIRPPKVSVCIITYNQIKYIRRCLESIFNQETDFEYEVIIGDDCSSDGTREIIKEFESLYPEILRPIFHDKNIGAMNNYLTVHRAARGEFVCHVDGDDWVRPNKLYIQNKFLDENKQYALLAHRAGIWEDGRQISITKENPSEIDLPLLLRRHPMFVHSSIMYRRDRFSDFFELNRIFIDFYLYISATTRGGIGFINEVLGDYRSNVGVSSAHNLMPYIQDAINYAAKIIGDTLDVRRSRARAYLSYAVAALLADEIEIFHSYLRNSIKSDRSWMTPKLMALAAFHPKSLKIIIRAYKERSKLYDKLQYKIK